MIIIEQNGKAMWNFDQVMGLKLDRGAIFCCFATGESSIIGVYESAERAQEVLDEISKAYKDCELYKITHPAGISPKFRFQMPEK